MKETQQHQPDTVKSVEQRQIEKQEVFKGVQRKIPGLTTWEYEIATNTLRKAEFAKIGVDIKGVAQALKGGRQLPATAHFKLVMKQGCIYCQALNEANAWKKIHKVYPLSKYIQK